MLIELTSKYTNEPIAIDHELIGEVKDQSPVGQPRDTLIIHKRNRRVHWTVTERYEQVMEKIRIASACTRGSGPGRSNDVQLQMAAVPEHGHGADLAGQAAVPKALA